MTLSTWLSSLRQGYGVGIFRSRIWTIVDPLADFNGGVVLDIRTEPECTADHLQGAQNIPLETVPRSNFRADRRILSYCQIGHR